MAHRCALPYPEDAKEFATELIAAELYNVISMEETADKFLSAEVLESWIDHIAAACHIFTDHRKAEASSDTVKEFIRGGENVVDTSNNRQHAHGDPSKKVSKAQAVNSCSLVEIFYKDPEESWQKSREFARLSTFKREAAVVSITWNPILSLGSVLKSELPTQGDAEYLICMQPRCDAVRLKGNTAFPFQTAVPTREKFNLVVRNTNGQDVELRVDLKPRDAVMLKFEPSENKKVQAQRRGSDFVFTDIEGRSFIWIGDIKDLKVQRDVSALAARVHSVGIEDFEWLRRATIGRQNNTAQKLGMSSRQSPGYEHLAFTTEAAGGISRPSTVYRSQYESINICRILRLRGSTKQCARPDRA